MVVRAGAIRAGKGYVELYSDNTMLERGLRNAQAKIRAFSASVSQMGMGMLKFAGIFAVPLALGVKAFSDFETQMANVSTMLDEPEKHMKAFKKAVSDMSVEYGESTETLAKGLYDILSASIPAGDALYVLEQSARAAKAGLTDTGIAADAVTTILNANKLAASKAGDIFDFLFAVVKHGKTTFPEIAESIGLVATTAASAGVPLEEMGAALATITRAGIKPRRAVIALNAIISTFLKPTKEAAESARALGFELSSTTIKAEGLSGVFNRLAKLPPDAIAKIFPNIRALRGVLPALGNIELFMRDVANMTNRAGKNTAAYDKIVNTLKHRLNQLKQSVVAAGRAIGAALAGSVGKAAEVLRDILKLVTYFISENGKFIRTVAKVTLVVAGLGLGLLALGAMGSVTAFVLGGLASIIGAIISAFGMLIATIGFVLSPIGLLSAAIVAVGYNLVTTSGIVRTALAWLGKKFKALKDIAVKAWAGITTALAQGDVALAAKILWLSLKIEWQHGIHYLKTLWANFKDFFLSMATNAFYGAVSLLADGFAGLEVAWAETTAFMSSIWTTFTSGIVRAWNVAQGWLAKRWIDIMGFFDETLDVEVVKKSIDEETGQINERVAAETGRALDAREKKRQAERQRIEEMRQGTQAAIWDEAGSINENRRRQYAKDIEASESALAAARAEWKSAMQEVADGAPGAEDKKKDALANLIDALGGVASPNALQGTVAGSFNASAADRMGFAGGAAERTAKATEQTASNTNDMNNKLDDLAMEFE